MGRTQFQSTRPIRGATSVAQDEADRTSISIHAPHTGRDLRLHIVIPRDISFQSTRPIRGATSAASRKRRPYRTFQSTRPIRGATPVALLPVCRRLYFNPRAPYGARRALHHRTAPDGRISIHAPHTGRDAQHFVSLQIIIDFNPRAPYGARHSSNRGHDID